MSTHLRMPAEEERARIARAKVRLEQARLARSPVERLGYLRLADLLIAAVMTCEAEDLCVHIDHMQFEVHAALAKEDGFELYGSELFPGPGG